ncbi:hypothetical protein BV25DRAFT_659995 [Artomyces pyxidatus]|uniref:Uncharacterized protein n=1 Tax=Artomyces pyxidatus TaxID=48021 RepID=A0ACB8T0J7_9AGAM|nr:hypothetical protein BV25DRAFT_659995 [Artomyces pyxidatus]
MVRALLIKRSDPEIDMCFMKQPPSLFSLKLAFTHERTERAHCGCVESPVGATLYVRIRPAALSRLTGSPHHHHPVLRSIIHSVCCGRSPAEQLTCAAISFGTRVGRLVTASRTISWSIVFCYETTHAHAWMQSSGAICPTSSRHIRIIFTTTNQGRRDLLLSHIFHDHRYARRTIRPASHTHLPLAFAQCFHVEFKVTEAVHNLWGLRLW